MNTISNRSNRQFRNVAWIVRTGVTLVSDVHVCMHKCGRLYSRVSGHASPVKLEIRCSEIGSEGILGQ